MGKGGVGKSSTVNSIIGERVVAVSAFQVWCFCFDIEMKRYRFSSVSVDEVIALDNVGFCFSLKLQDR